VVDSTVESNDKRKHSRLGEYFLLEDDVVGDYAVLKNMACYYYLYEF